MIKLKKLIKESTWDRKFGEPLPTLKGIMEKHNDCSCSETTSCSCDSVNEGSKAVKAYKELGSAITTAIYGIKNFRKIVLDGPYDRKIERLTGALYNFEIDLEKKLRLLLPQIKKISADKRLESVTEDVKDVVKAKKLGQKLGNAEGRLRKVMYDLEQRFQADTVNFKLQKPLKDSYKKHVTAFMRDAMKLIKKVK